MVKSMFVKCLNGKCWLRKENGNGNRNEHASAILKKNGFGSGDSGDSRFHPRTQANLTGLRDGVLNKKPDISAIRKWVNSLDIPSGASYANIDVQTAPHFIKSLAPHRIVVYKTNIHNDKQLFRSVSFEWYTFAIVGMAIGPPEMPPQTVLILGS